MNWPPPPKLYTGYDPETDTTYRLTVFDNGEREIASRPGKVDAPGQWPAGVTLTAVRP